MSYDIAIRLRLTTRKKLLVGAGGLAAKTRADVMFTRIRTGSGVKIFIPASTIKGVLRTSLIRISRLLGYKVTPSVNPAKLGSTDDIVTRLFGRPHGPPSKLIFTNAVLEEPQPITLTHVRISDETETAEEGGLYSAEYLPIGESFVTEIRGYGLTLEEVEALMAAIAELRYERIGKAGVIDVKIDLEGSRIPREVADKSEIVRLILNALGGGGP